MWETIKKWTTQLKASPFVLALGIAGIALLLVGSFGGGCDRETANETQAATPEEYRAEMTREAEALCRRVKGAGDTYIMLTFETGESSTYSGSHQTSTTPPRVLGVAVVSEGARSDTVRAELTELLCALFHIGANRVHVSPAK